MKKIYILLAISLVLSACSDRKRRFVALPDDSEVVVPPQEIPTVDPATLKLGWNFTPTTPNPTKPLVITYVAEEGTPLYGAEGDLYLHSGVNAKWIGAPEWNNNNPKYKLSPVKGLDNAWQIVLTPTVASFYGVSKPEIVKSLNVIVRSADGSKQTDDYSVIAGLTEFDTKTVKYGALPANIQAPIEGVHVESATQATFVLYDKDTKGKHHPNVFFLCEANKFAPSNDYKMTYDKEKHCWWFTAKKLKAGANSYQYLLVNPSGDVAPIADPYATEVIENGSKFASFPKDASGRYVGVVNTTAQPYAWQVPNFKLEHQGGLVVYELLLRDFTDQRNLEGALEKLPYLKELGVNAIELMPVQEFGGDESWGYNTSFYFALDKAYGSKEAYKHFIDECHKQGIGVILDVVYNHTTNDNPFAKLYWDSNRNRPLPTNPYLNDVTPHKKFVFSPNDFNHQSKLTQDFVIRNLHYMLEEYKFDGFRFDFTKGFTQKQTEDNAGLDAWDQQRVDILKKYAQAVKSKKSDAVVIMEHLIHSEENELANVGIKSWRNVNHAYGQACMGFANGSGFNAMYDDFGTRISYMESHDEERLGYKQLKWGLNILKNTPEHRASLLAADAAFCFSVPGQKMIWQFGELGYNISINQGGRVGIKPTGWNLLQKPETKIILDTYKCLLKVRNDNPDLFNGSAQFDWQVSQSNWADGRTLHLHKDERELVVLANFKATKTKVHFVADERHTDWKDLMTGQTVSLDPNNSPEVTQSSGLGVDVLLDGFSYKIYGRKL